MTAMLAGSFYEPKLGGHAPGDLRNAFQAALEAYESWEAGEPEPTVEVREQDVPISKVCGLVWNCSDILSNTVWGWITNLCGNDEEPKSRTYGAAARWLKPLIAGAA